jgi:hypothetical protein
MIRPPDGNIKYGLPRVITESLCKCVEKCKKLGKRMDNSDSLTLYMTGTIKSREKSFLPEIIESLDLRL